MNRSSPQLAYYQTHELTATLRGQTIRVISKPGLPEWDSIPPATALLANAVEVRQGGRALLLSCHHGALGAALAGDMAGGSVALLDSSYIATAMAELTLRANDVPNARVCPGITVLPQQAGAYDTAILQLPKGRKLARRWLVEAYGALAPEGQLYVAGSNEQGIQPTIKDVEALFGNAAVLAYKKGNRVARASKGPRAGEPDWAQEPGIAPGTWHEFQVDVRRDSYRLRSLPGVFSYDRLDDGTSLLLSVLGVPKGAEVLDVGCGYGIIGLAAARWGAAHVDMVDVDLLAVAAARENVALNGLQNAEAFPSDVLSAVQGKRYDLVVSNPPFHVGRAVEYGVAQAFIEDARRVLRPGGQLAIVANKFIRYDQVMRGVFGSVARLAETGRYHVLAASR